MWRAACAALALAPVCEAAKDKDPVGYKGPQEVLFVGKAGAWENAESWNNKQVPDATTFVSLRNAVSVSLSQKTGSIAALHIGSTKPTTLTVEKGGVLEVGDVRVWRNVSDSQGILNIDGGEFKSVLISVGGCRTLSSTGILNLNSGKLLGRVFVGSDLPNTGTGTLSINGSDAQVGSHAGRMQLVVAASGTVVFNLDAKGAPTLDYARSNVSLSEGSKVIVNGAKYTGGPKSIPLIISGDFKDKGAVLETEGFPKGTFAQILKKPNGLVLSIEKEKR